MPSDFLLSQVTVTVRNPRQAGMAGVSALQKGQVVFQGRGRPQSVNSPAGERVRCELPFSADSDALSNERDR